MNIIIFYYLKIILFIKKLIYLSNTITPYFSTYKCVFHKIHISQTKQSLWFTFSVYNLYTFHAAPDKENRVYFISLGIYSNITYILEVNCILLCIILFYFFIFIKRDKFLILKVTRVSFMLSLDRMKEIE